MPLKFVPVSLSFEKSLLDEIMKSKKERAESLGLGDGWTMAAEVRVLVKSGLKNFKKDKTWKQ